MKFKEENIFKNESSKAPPKKKESFSSSDSDKKKKKKKNLLTQEPIPEIKPHVSSQVPPKEIIKSKIQHEEPKPTPVSNPYNFKTKEDDSKLIKSDRKFEEKMGGDRSKGFNLF